MNPQALYGHPDQPFALVDGKSISRRQFWTDVEYIRRTLKSSHYVINDCKNRYAFLVSFFASVINGQISLFPSSRAPSIMASVMESYPDVYCISDQSLELEQIETLNFDFSCLEQTSYVDAVEIPDTQTVLIAFTSGTTGKPKTYEKSWGGFLHEARVAGISLGVDHQQVERCIATIPAQHMYGFIASIMVPLYYGIVIEANTPFYAEDIRCELDKHPQSTMLITTPIQLRNCLQDCDELSHLAFILSSAAPLDSKTALAAESRYEVPIYEFYGSTETGAIAFREPTKTDTWTSFNDISLQQEDDWLGVSAPYFKQSQVIEDYVEVLDDRNFIFKGRHAEIIKVSGKRTSLNDLNTVLLSIDGVVDGTFYQFDKDLDGRLSVIVVAHKLDRNTLHAALKGQMDEVFLPRKIIFLDRLPRTQSGKLPFTEIEKLRHLC